MKNSLIIGTLMALAGSFSVANAAGLGGVPIKDHHMKALGSFLTCETCHGVALPTERPSDKSCKGCHGTMDKIQTKPNKFNKFPHASQHYGNTLDCTTCHSEHKKSRSLCNDCHVVDFPNLK